jgi:hypothetical protein
MHKKLNWIFSVTAQVSHQVFSFFVSSVCLLVRVPMMDKSKAVVFCLLTTSAIILSEKKKRKRKILSKKWYLKRMYHATADWFVRNGCWVWVPWDDAIVVWAGKRVNCWIPWVTCAVFVWKSTGKDSSDACVISGQNYAVYSVFSSGMTSHSKTLILTESV